MRTSQQKYRTQGILGIPYSDVNQQYLLGSELGEGVAGTVRICTALGGKDGQSSALACKTVRKKTLTSATSVRQLRREVRALREAGDHPSVVALKDVLEDGENVHLIMELCQGGDLFDRIKQWKRFSEGEASRVTQTILSVLRNCHAKGIAHRDVKPENILLKSWTSNTDVKLVDFGQAEFFTVGQKMTKPVGSKYYVAPEVLDCSYGPEADLWSLGVTLYILLSGSPPFMAKKQKDLFQKIKVGVYDIETGPWRRISNKAKHLVCRMLCSDPSRRITAEEALVHPWILQQCGVHAPIRSLSHTLPVQEALQKSHNFGVCEKDKSSGTFPKCKTDPAPPSVPQTPIIPLSRISTNNTDNASIYSSSRKSVDYDSSESRQFLDPWVQFSKNSSLSSSSSPLRNRYSTDETTSSPSSEPSSPSSPSKNSDSPTKRHSSSSRFRFSFSSQISTPPSSWSQRVFAPIADVAWYNPRAKNAKCTFRLSTSSERESESERRSMERRSHGCFRPCGSNEMGAMEEMETRAIVH